jgi:uncharacterized protein involved in oxidation of intracellular sulfur
MKLGVIITQADPETVFNALRLALYSLQQGDFDVKAQAQKVLDAGGQFLACGACLKLRNSGGSEVCPLSTLKDQYEVVRESDRVVTV